MRALALLCFVTTLTGCYSWRAAEPDALVPERPPGAIRVTLVGGQALMLENALLVRDTVIGQRRERPTSRSPSSRPQPPIYGFVRIPRPDIERVEIRHFDTRKTIGRTAVLGLGLLALTISLTTAGVGSSSP